LALLTLGGDHLTGPAIQFPILFLIPVALASWHDGMISGLVLAIFMPVTRLYFFTIWPNLPWSMWEAGINDGISVIVFGVFAYLINWEAVRARVLQEESGFYKGFCPFVCFVKKLNLRIINGNPWSNILLNIPRQNLATVCVLIVLKNIMAIILGHKA
jgi:hypothetical protein